MTFTLSIENTNGQAYVHGFHLGTIESVARQIAEEKFQYGRDRHGHLILTVALIRNGKIFDVYDGKWLNSSYAVEA